MEAVPGDSAGTSMKLEAPIAGRCAARPVGVGSSGRPDKETAEEPCDVEIRSNESWARTPRSMADCCHDSRGSRLGRLR
jgi:hypothetical protein